MNATTYGITSDGGADDIVLPEADTNNAGLLGADKWDEIVANTATKHTQGTDTTLGAQVENLDMNTHKIVGVVDPTTDQEAATKKYVDDTKIADGGTPTDNALVRWNGTGGLTVQDSTVKVSDNGEMTNASQPCFIAYISPTQVDKTGDGTEFTMTGSIWGELKDQNNDFSNGTFTAPVTGNYILTWFYVLDDAVDSAHTYGYTTLTTSNRIFYTFGANPYVLSANGQLYIIGSMVVEMDANDTAYLTIRIYYGTKTIDIATTTYFTGALLN